MIKQYARIVVVGLVAMCGLIVGVTNSAYAAEGIGRGQGIAGAPAVKAVSAQSVASNGDSWCSTTTCNFTFTRGQTAALTNYTKMTGACALVPTPGNVLCAAGALTLISFANDARKQNACLKITWVRYVQPPAVPWWPSVDKSGHCKN